MNLARMMEFDKKSIKWLSDLNRDGMLEVDDSFQRRFVWTRSQRIALIETIVMGYPIPEIYLWKTGVDPESGDTTYSIVDGQQRLKSVFNYLGNSYSLENRSIDDKDADYANKEFKELDDELKTQIWDYPFFVRIIPREIAREEIVKMFLRLNKTDTSLNPQELRNAKYEGLFLELALELSQNEFWDSYKFFNKNDVRRMKDVQFISTLLMFFRYGIEGETSQKWINKAYDEFNEEYAEHDEDKATFEAILELIDLLANGDDLISKFISSQVHFYALFVLGYEMVSTGKSFTKDHQRAYTEFITTYQTLPKDEVPNPEDNNRRDVYDYRVAATEGVQKKTNRMLRYKKLKSYLMR